MRRLTGILAAAALLVAGLVPPAIAVEPLGFDDPAKQERYEQLLHELRCLVCQNESLASSGAGLAGDLRREVHRMVAEGKSNEQIKQFLVERYGDFVLYRPRVTAKTYLLWFGPFVLAVIGMIALVIAIRRRGRITAHELDPADRDRLQQLLDKHRDDRR